MNYEGDSYWWNIFHIIKNLLIYAQQLWGQSRRIWCSSKGLMFRGVWRFANLKKTHLSYLMQAEWMCLEIHVLLSHDGVFDFKPIFSWSLYFIKSISVHYIKALSNSGRKKESLVSEATHRTGESKPLIGIGVYTFMNQTNKCYHKRCCSCQTKCIMAVILPSQSFTLSVPILHTVFCVGSSSGFLSVPN